VLCGSSASGGRLQPADSQFAWRPSARECELIEIGPRARVNFDAGHAPSGGGVQRVLTELCKLAGIGGVVGQAGASRWCSPAEPKYAHRVKFYNNATYSNRLVMPRDRCLPSETSSSRTPFPSSVCHQADPVHAA
jgi:hypothetical protein